MTIFTGLNVPSYLLYPSRQGLYTLQFQTLWITIISMLHKINHHIYYYLDYATSDHLLKQIIMAIIYLARPISKNRKNDNLGSKKELLTVKPLTKFDKHSVQYVN